MANVLAIFTSYSTDVNDPDLGSSLVQQLRNDGHEVTSLAFGMYRRGPQGRDKNLQLVPLVTGVPVLKYVLSWPIFVAKIVALRLGKRRYHFHHLIVQAPISVKMPVVLLFGLFSFQRCTAIVFDIYPRHQLRLGMLPKALGPALHRVESWLIQHFDTLTAMGDRNRQAIRDYYLHEDSNKEIRIVRPWSEDEEFHRVAPNTNVKQIENVRLIFGGQVATGRRVDLLIDFLAKVRQPGLDVRLDIFSFGPKFEKLKCRFEHLEWVQFYPRMPRREYLRLLPTYNIGAIATDGRVPLPTLPSKIVDYARSGLSSLCLVEEESELFNLAQTSQCIYVNNFDFSQVAVEQAREFCKYAASLDAQREAVTLGEAFSVEAAAREIMR